MIGKIRKDHSFGGCIRYVTQKDDSKIIALEGVLLETTEEMVRNFRWQSKKSSKDRSLKKMNRFV